MDNTTVLTRKQNRMQQRITAAASRKSKNRTIFLKLKFPEVMFIGKGLTYHSRPGSEHYDIGDDLIPKHFPKVAEYAGYTFYQLTPNLHHHLRHTSVLKIICAALEVSDLFDCGRVYYGVRKR